MPSVCGSKAARMRRIEKAGKKRSQPQAEVAITISGPTLGTIAPRHRDSSSAEESYRHEHTEDESTDMSEERDTAATGFRMDQPVIANDELVQKPAAKVQPSCAATRPAYNVPVPLLAAAIPPAGNGDCKFLVSGPGFYVDRVHDNPNGLGGRGLTVEAANTTAPSGRRRR
jgi:hypothetical protein